MTNALNQYTSVGGAAYAYDGNGKGLPNAMDRVWEPNMTYDGDGMMYAYDPENRLTTVNKIDGLPKGDILLFGSRISLRSISGGKAECPLFLADFGFL